MFRRGGFKFQLHLQARPGGERNRALRQEDRLTVTAKFVVVSVDGPAGIRLVIDGALHVKILLAVIRQGLGELNAILRHRLFRRRERKPIHAAAVMHFQEQAVLPGPEQRHHFIRSRRDAAIDLSVLDLGAVQPQLGSAIAAEGELDVTRRLHRDVAVEIGHLILARECVSLAVLPIRLLLPAQLVLFVGLLEVELGFVDERLLKNLLRRAGLERPQRRPLAPFNLGHRRFIGGIRALRFDFESGEDEISIRRTARAFQRQAVMRQRLQPERRQFTLIGVQRDFIRILRGIRAAGEN